jgi:aryl-alcohol dehydrogenase-like predicted oxidoreductase
MTWLRADKSPSEQTPKQIAEAIDASLKRLQTDYIDLYQLHWPDRPVAMFGANGLTYRHSEGSSVPIADILGALDDHVKAGKIRWIGLSNETAWGTMSFLHEAARTRGPRVQSIQNAYSLINRTFEIGLAEVAMREQVGLLAYSPLAQGFLTGKYQGGALPPGARKTLFNRQQRYESPQSGAAIDRYLAIAKEFGLDPAQMALKFVTQRPFVTATILGATTIEQLKTDIASVDVAWTPELEKAIDAAHHAQPNPAP